MSNFIDYHLDVLAGSPEEINGIAAHLKQPSAELVNRVAKAFGREVATELTDLVPFRPVENLFFVDEDINKARRFENGFQVVASVFVDSHLFEVSREYPAAIFLLTHIDMAYSYSGKVVIHAGDVVKEIFDGKQRAQAIDWALPDIFAPFKAEWDRGLEFGSLWNEWINEFAAAVEDLRKPPQLREASQKSVEEEIQPNRAQEASSAGAETS